MTSQRQHFRCFLSDCRVLTSGAIRVLRRYSKISIVFWIGVSAAAAVLHLADASIAATLEAPHNESLHGLAVALSRWGNYGTGIMIAAVGMWLAGAFLKRDRLRQAGVACFMAATIALLAVNVTKTVSGRPRPYARMPDRFTGLNTEEKLRSFPSGHSTTAMAAAATVSVVYPAVAAPAVLIAVGVAWSRVYLEQHYLTDVIVGGAFGMWLGLAFGLATRRGAAKNGRGT